MLYPISAGYQAEDESGAYFGHIAQGDFFCVIEVFEGFSKEQGDGFLAKLAGVMAEKKPATLRGFEEELQSYVKQAGIPVDFSLSAGYHLEKIFYLKTIGSGQIYIRRGNHFEQLIAGDNSASGYVEEKDMFAFTTSYFMEAEQEAGFLKKAVMHKMPEAVVSSIIDSPHHKDGGTSLFVSFEKKPELILPTEPAAPQIRFKPPETQSPKPAYRQALQQFIERVKTDRKKVIALGICAVVLVALFLNAGSLFGKKQQTNRQAKVGSAREQIEADLKTIDTEGDRERALGVVAASRQLLKDLKAKDKNLKPEDVQALEEQIDSAESKVLKREEKSAEEFYDLALEEKDGRADRMYLNGETLALLNRSGKIYLLNLDNKSVEKKVYPEIANAELVSAWESGVFFIRQGTGIYKIQGDEKPKRVIEADTEWGKIAAMTIYNGNIYLLDRENDEVYKYLVAENGYSDKNSYITSGKMALGGANSLAIDSAVYIGLDDMVVKYLAGAKEEFTSEFPESDITLTKTYTDKEIDDVYVLDKPKGVVYVLTKEGAYKGQIKSASLKQADDFAVYKDAIFVLSKSKVLRIAL